MATDTEGETVASEVAQFSTETSSREEVLLWIDNHLKWLMTIPAVLILFLLTFYPLLRALQFSTQSYLPTGTVFVGIENYVQLLSDGAFINSLVVTAKFVGIAVTLEFLIGFAMALVLNKKIKIRGLWQTLILVPMILSPTVIGLIWRLMYAPNGLLDYIAAPLTGGANVGWISETSMALYSVILTDIWQWTPLVVLVLFAGLQSVPDDISEAAIMDGASRRQRFIHITLPYLKSLIVLILIIRLVDALRVFAKVFILTRGGPSDATNVISMEMYRTAFRFNNFGEASAMAVSLLVLVLILAMSFVKIANVEFGS
ncbi:carbohydrate ABC transporter permease [Haloarcula sp. Atlit-7R]|uniref:carbohydrate ABC transporter permease n=1 Tax=Haloarcula sp. Atlit-7R TaxID=2282125 RepID=UPI000EF154A2|nr:sugar ABC transporter permease [Haloarcula sp. Atlit-7R]RLM90021.1 sugar ABC transporter permease [Haloarcula sp. Atlit-7R]